MAKARLNVEITADASDALGDLGRLENRIEGIGRAVQGSNLGQSLTEIGQGATNLGRSLVGSIGGIGRTIVGTAAKFESSMADVVAKTGVTGEEFEMLEEQAKKLGRTTSFSASQAADAMGFLAMAGFDSQQIFSALPGVLQLAAASGGDLATVADQASDILGTFGLKAEEIGRVNNVIAETSRTANVDLNTLFETFKMSAPIAADAGVSLELMSAAAGLIGSAGIKGSQGGTTLKNVILGLIAPSNKAAGTMADLGFETVRTANGNLDLLESLRQLEKTGATTAQLKDIFGRDIQLAGISILLKNLENLAQAEKGLVNVGDVAQEMADIKMNTFTGQIKALESAFEGLQLAIADTGLLTDLTTLVTKLTGFVSKMAEANPELLKLGVTVGVIGFALGAVLIPLGMIISSVGTLITLFSSGVFASLGAKIGTIATSLWAVVSPLVIIVAKVGLVIAAIGAAAVIIPTVIGLIALLGSKLLQIAANIARAAEEFFGFPPIVSNALTQASLVVAEFAASMFNFGLKIITTLADGVKAGVGALTGAFKWVFEQGKKFMSGSDAQKGPLSNLTASGEAIPKTIAQGMAKGTQTLENQFATTLAPPSPIGPNSSPVNNSITVSNNITVNGNMDNEQRQSLMAQLDEKANELTRLVQRTMENQNRTKYA